MPFSASGIPHRSFMNAEMENTMRQLASFVLPILVAASTSGVLFTATLI